MPKLILGSASESKSEIPWTVIEGLVAGFVLTISITEQSKNIALALFYAKL
jgi:hypothetical protein